MKNSPSSRAGQKLSSIGLSALQYHEGNRGMFARMHSHLTAPHLKSARIAVAGVC
jgi:hypothetical protein